jgi:hypothetical protein
MLIHSIMIVASDRVPYGECTTKKCHNFTSTFVQLNGSFPAGYCTVCTKKLLDETILTLIQERSSTENV